MRIVKDKNILNFIIEPTRIYKLDLNSGCMNGLRGKALVRVPKPIASYLAKARFIRSNNVITLLTYMAEYGYSFGDPNIKMGIIVADKLDSLFINLRDAGVFPNYWVEHSSALNENFKEFVKAWREQGPEYSFFSEFIYECEIKAYLKQAGVNLPMTPELRAQIKDAQGWNITPEQFPYYLRYMNKNGLWALKEILDTSLLFIVTRYFKACDELGIPYTKENNVMQIMTDTLREYSIGKKEKEALAVKTYQEKYSNMLTYSNDLFETMIPLTFPEFLEESNALHNCVARDYYPKVAKNECNIVFIREKTSPDESYICCEVRNGRIKQFLTFYNRRPEGVSIRDFKKEYEEHLKKHWIDEI